jgi:hypothetical protein
MVGLLHLQSARLSRQGAAGYQKREPFANGALEAHLLGTETYAFAVVERATKRAFFAAVDVDADFELLAPVLRSILLGVGGDELIAASFLTDGSAFGRGKIVTTFAEPFAHHDARSLASLVVRRIRNTDAGRLIPTSALTAFPQDRSGGILRVLGRNAARGGPLENAFTLDGEPAPLLEQVRPLTRSAFARIQIEATVPPFVRRLLAEPWRRDEGTRVHFGRMCRLATESIRIYGETAGRSAFDAWLDTVRAHSPELALSSRKNGDPRNVTVHGAERAWEIGLAPAEPWCPNDTTSCPPTAARLYLALMDFVQRNGLRPGAFSLDFATIAQLLDLRSKSHAYRVVVTLERKELLVRHDRGTLDAPGVKGVATTYGLVGFGETPADVLAAGRRDPLVLDRVRRAQGQRQREFPEFPEPSTRGARAREQTRTAETLRG